MTSLNQFNQDQHQHYHTLVPVIYQVKQHHHTLVPVIYQVKHYWCTQSCVCSVSRTWRSGGLRESAKQCVRQQRLREKFFLLWVAVWTPWWMLLRAFSQGWWVSSKLIFEKLWSVLSLIEELVDTEVLKCTVTCQTAKGFLWFSSTIFRSSCCCTVAGTLISLRESGQRD